MKKKMVITILCALFAIATVGCGKNKAVKDTEALIAAIGTVSLDSKAAIERAETHYDALTNDQKNDLENYVDLVEARKKYDEMVMQAKAEEEASAVVAAINELGTPAFYVQADIDRVIEMYETLDNVAKECVTNYNVLEGIVNTPTQIEQIAVNLLSGIRDNLYNPESLQVHSVKIQDGTQDFSLSLATVDYSGMNKMGGNTRDTKSYTLWGKEATYDPWLSPISFTTVDMYSEYFKLSDKLPDAVEIDVDRILNLME